MSVRIDNDLLEYLDSQPNKGMAINNAIRYQAQRWNQKAARIEFADKEDCSTCRNANLNTLHGGVWCTKNLQSYNAPQAFCIDYEEL